MDVNAVTEQALAVVERLLGENIRLHRRLQPGLPPVSADRSQIEQILLNLIVNARDAMPEGGVIEIATSAFLLSDPDEAARLGLGPGRYVRLSVRDEGHGMDEATRARIFEPFFTTKEPGKGTGLGLTAVYGTVQSLGGAIRVESAPGQGTTFEIDPLAAPQTHEAQAAAGGRPNLHPARRGRRRQCASSPASCWNTSATK